MPLPSIERFLYESGVLGIPIIMGNQLFLFFENEE